MFSQDMNEVTAQLFWAVTRSRKVAELHEKIRKLQADLNCAQDVARKKAIKAEKDRLKKRLPGFTPHALMGKSRCKESVAHVSGMIMVDADDVENPQSVIDALMPRIEELGIVYMGISISGNGVRVFFLCPQGMTIEKAQMWFCEKTGLERDGQCIDIARFSYAVPEANIKYINEKVLFEGEAIEPWCDDAKVMEEREGKQVARSGKKKNGAEAEKSDAEVAVAANPNRMALVAELMNIPFDETQAVDGVECKVLYDQYFLKLYGKLPGPGDRHNKMGKAVMQLASLFGSDPRRIMACTPRYGIESRELAELIVDKLNWTDSCMSYAGAASKVESMIGRIISENRNTWDSSPYPAIETAEQCWDLLPRQPKWVKEWLSIVPKCVRYAAMVAATPGEMTLADRVTCRYQQFRPTDLAAAAVVMGLSGGFKGAAMAPAVQMMKILKEETDGELAKENEFYARRELAKGKKDKAAVMEDRTFNIRYLPTDTTKNRHIECLRCKRTTYTESAELSALIDSMKRTAYDRKSFLLMCFDRSPVGSQVKAGLGGVNDTQPCKWNYMCGANMTSLYKAYPETSLTTGDIFRLTLVCVPNTFGRQSELYVGEYTEEQEELIHRVGELLMKCEGETFTPKLSKAIHAWNREKESELMTKKDLDRLMLLGRIPLIAYRIGQVIHLSWGIQSILDEEKKSGTKRDVRAIDVSKFKEHKETAETAVMIAENLFDTMCRFFYKRLKARNQYEAELVMSDSNNCENDLCRELPEGQFTYDSLSQTVWKGTTETTIRQRINRLMRDGKVRKVDTKQRKAVFEKI